MWKKIIISILFRQFTTDEPEKVRPNIQEAWQQWKMDSMSRKCSSCINTVSFDFLNPYILEFEKNQLNFSNFRYKSFFISFQK